MNKTIEEIIWEHTPMNEYPTYYHESDIELMIQAYADQEKRREVLAFDKWTGENGYIRFSDGRSRYSKGFASFSTDHLYDLYLQSLNKKDNNE